jgi:hypothetical protein
MLFPSGGRFLLRIVTGNKCVNENSEKRNDLSTPLMQSRVPEHTRLLALCRCTDETRSSECCQHASLNGCISS